ncbi:hypothetical protein [Limosilactobacillus caccae]|jgi:hypothetical protein|nr:hypothetical protein [Limosilactobacillus caccae]
MKFVWLAAYLITAFFTFTNQMMLAMDWMAGTMLAEAAYSAGTSLWQKKK